VRDVLHTKHYSYRTEKTYIDWIKRYILFHQKRHPKDMGAEEVQAFITHLATERKVAASTHTVLAVGARETRHSAPSSSYIASSCRVGLRQKEINLPPARSRNMAFASAKTTTGAMATAMKGFKGILFCSFVFILCLKISKVLS
jgi:hypothetical protein